MKLKLVRIVETCIAAPSQWDAWDAEGKYYYLRFRHSKGSVEGFDGPDFWEHVGKDDPYPTTHYENHWDNGNGFGDSFIELEDFAEQSGLDISGAEIIRQA